MTKPFIHLHTHTLFSILDGISRREDIIKKAKADGQTAVAVTEHGALFNSISWYKSCKDAGIKGVIGLEAYVAPDTRFGKSYVKKGEAEEDAKNGDLAYYAYHLTLLAKNREGYDNLKKLSTLSYREGFYRKPRIDDEILAAHKNGLIVLSGCLASKTSRLIIAGNKEKALEEIDKMRGIFGEDFFLEVMHHNIDEEATVREALIDFGKARGIGLVMTGDSHYTEANDVHAHDVALAIGTGKTIHDPNRWSFNGSGYWFKTSEEMRAAATDAHIPEYALDATYDIAQRIDDYGFKLVSETKKSIIPHYRDSDGKTVTDEDCHTILSWMAHEGLSKRGKMGVQEYEQRLEFELDMIKRKNFSSYFLIIADIIENGMRRKGIWPPVGRGSSLGSLVCYCLYITGRDPIEHKLPFGRFINEGRKDLPDIDTDISQARRKEVIDYIISKYGKDNVAQIVTFQSMSAKAVADNVGRALGVPSAIRRNLGKLLGELTKDDKLEEVLEDNKAAKSLMEQTPGWIEVCKRLEGNNRNLGSHAAGIVISNEPIIEHVPLLRDSNEGHLITQYDMKDLGELGLLKLDMLGLKTMDLIQNTMELIKERKNVNIDYQCIPLDDQATYRLVASGKFVSVFQYDSSGLRGAAQSLVPQNFEHLVALNALYRPGPMLPGSGTDGKTMMQNYIDRRHGREEVAVWHPDLEEVFKDTFGIPIFQEQVMKLSQILGKFTDEEADEYRSAIGKKDAVKFKKVQEKLVGRGIQNGYSKEFMEDVAKRLAGSARYNWNRGHSVVYSYLSYVTAWLETNYPIEYFTTLLNVNIGESDQLKILLSSILPIMVQRGGRLLPPHINNSQSFFYTDDKDIYMGLYSVRQVGDASAPAILDDRKANGPYLDFLDFCLRMRKYSRVNKLTKENLVKAGAFDWDTSMTRKDMVNNIELIQDLIKKFDGKLPPTELRAEIQKRLALSLTEYSNTEKLDFEKTVLNFYISSHPVTQYRPVLGLFSNVSFISPSQINDQMSGSRTLMLAVVEQRTMKQTRNGDPYLQLRVADELGTLTVNVWHPLAGKAYSQLIDNQLCLLFGRVQEDKFRPGEMQLNVHSATPIITQNGIPISSFYVEDVPTANRILSILNVPGIVSESILNQGHMVTLHGPCYIRPEQVSNIRNCGRSNFAIAI